MKIIHLHVKREYWQQVKDKKKVKEYRIIKPYWTKRLKKLIPNHDLIYYYKGYPRVRNKGNCMVFRYKGYVEEIIKHKEFGDKPVNVYSIYVG